MLIEVFGLNLNTYTAAISAAIVIAAIVTMIQLRKAASPVRVIDALIPALVIGYALARLEHIALQWAYFSAAALPVAEWVFPVREGGLGWHGAVIGALIGVIIGARWQRIDVRRLISACALALPLIACGGWVGCAAVGCAYGIEVDTLARYSPLIVHEVRDIFGIVAPRIATQSWGMVLAFVVALVLFAPRGRSPGLGRVFMAIMILSAGMCAIGVFRADSVALVFGVRGDQVGDLVLFGWAVYFSVRQLTGRKTWSIR